MKSIIHALASVRVGFNRWFTAFLHYNDTFKLHRRLIHGYIGTRAVVSRFDTVLETEAVRFVNALLNRPNKLELSNYLQV